MSTKICIKCKEIKELSEFGKCKNKPDGINYYCKKCENERTSAYKKTNPEQHRVGILNYGRSNKKRFNNGKNRAKTRGYIWEITIEQWESIIFPNLCHYCNKKLGLVAGHGLDRKDNDKGYILDNVVPCCKICNETKSNKLSYDEMLLIMKHRAQKL